jgi:hypothetical protein
MRDTEVYVSPPKGKVLVASLDVRHLAVLMFERFLPLIDRRFTTHDLRALGPVLVRAAKLGWIENTGSYVKSARRHMSPLTLWRSRVFGVVQ